MHEAIIIQCVHLSPVSRVEGVEMVWRTALALALWIASAAASAINGQDLEVLTRNVRQTSFSSSTQTSSSSSPAANGDGDCDFGVSPGVNTCGWRNLNLSAFEWRASSGADSFWVGGPRKDVDLADDAGGYAFFETSQLPNSPKAANTVSAMMASPTLPSTGSGGYCVTFGYAMHGLSPDKLRVLLHPFDDVQADVKDQIRDQSQPRAGVAAGFLDGEEKVRSSTQPRKCAEIKVSPFCRRGFPTFLRRHLPFPP